MKTTTLLILNFLVSFSIIAQDHSFDTTLVIRNSTFTVAVREFNEGVTLSVVRDSVHIIRDTLRPGLADIQFPDFDSDGNPDIELSFMGNNSEYNLNLFDIKSNTFKFVKDFENFPEAIQLKTNANFYYSYQRAGCADMDWVSDLFYIHNFSVVKIGHIYGRGCDSETRKPLRAIEIYKVLNNKGNDLQLIEKFPYLKNVPKFGDKWDFIEKYWNKNYQSFK